MDAWAVLDRLRTLPVPQQTDASTLITLCRAAVDELQPRIRDDADPDDPRLLRAAAGIACLLCACRPADTESDVSYFKAGDVTIRRETTDAVRIARELRDEGLRQALPLLRDDAFVFSAV
jgi:hypothetical protein